MLEKEGGQGAQKVKLTWLSCQKPTQGTIKKYNAGFTKWKQANVCVCCWLLCVGVFAKFTPLASQNPVYSFSY